MADVQPFCGLRYNVELIKDLTAVISPPYDVISAEEQKYYHQQSPHNVIRLEFGEEFPNDSGGDNKYIRAAKILEDWIKKEILIREPTPAFYVFQHRFAQESGIKERWGLTARVRLSRQGSMAARPHESVMEDRILDRLKLLQATRTNFSPIMAIVNHSRDNFTKLLIEAAKAGPDVTAMDHDGVIHNMWVIRDERSIAKITSWCSKKTLYIADGHHRYETATAYEREQKAINPYWSGEESFNFVMMTLIGSNDPGLVVLPTHRLVKLPDNSLMVDLKERINKQFHIEEITSPVGASKHETLKVWLDILAKHRKRHVTIGVYGLVENRFCLFYPRKESALQNLMPLERSREWKYLDVSILHWMILRQMLGIDTPQKESTYLEYTRDGMEAIEQVDSGKSQLSFLLNPIPISRVLAIADAGERMPPKSTYFYPKLPTGLVMYPLWD